MTAFFEFILGTVVLEIVGEPFRERLMAGITLNFLASFASHLIEDWEQTHVAVVLAESEGRLAEERVGNEVGVRQHGWGILLNSIYAQLGSSGELRRAVEILLSHLHNVKAGVDISELDHRRVVEEEVLSGGGWIEILKSLPFHTEDLHGQTARVWLLVWL